MTYVYRPCLEVQFKPRFYQILSPFMVKSSKNQYLTFLIPTEGGGGGGGGGGLSQPHKVFPR